MDYTDMTTAEIRAAIEDAQAEIERREREQNALTRVERITTGLLESMGGSDGGPWVATPLGYPEGYRAQHNGRLWESQIRANVWEPGDPDDPQSYRWWKDITPQPPLEPGETPEWDGAGHEYAVGDVVAYEGTEYSCIQAHTSQPGWAPPVVPAMWQPVEGEAS